MQYRRFGRTQLQMPVFSTGGMRYQQSWTSGEAFSAENQRNLEATIERSLEIGINHIETARGYGTSEEQLGQILPRLPRKELILQTKVAPTEDPARFLEQFEISMRNLKLDYVDLLGLHGINTEELRQWSVRAGGCLDAALKLKAQGRVRHIGFSTHGPTDLIVKTIDDGRFEYVNLHWYYVFPFNWAAIEAATRQQMGVFIISPSDKGGKLYEPSPKLTRLTQPLSPLVFNNVWCLLREQVHTLSIGAARPSDYDEHLKALSLLANPEQARNTIGEVEARLKAVMVETWGQDWVENWHRGLPSFGSVPGQVNIFEILRLHNYAKAFDMIEYGKMRYNLLGKGGHWFPGFQVDRLSGQKLDKCLALSPFAKKIPDILAEAHLLLKGEDIQRKGSH